MPVFPPEAKVIKTFPTWGREACELLSANTSATQPNLRSELHDAAVVSAVPRGQLCPAPGHIPHLLPQPTAVLGPPAHGPSVTALLLRREGAGTAYVSLPASCPSGGTRMGHWVVPGGGWGPTRQGEPRYTLRSIWRGPSTGSEPHPHGDLWSVKGRGGERSPPRLALPTQSRQHFGGQTLVPISSLTPATPKAWPLHHCSHGFSGDTRSATSAPPPSPFSIPPSTHGKGHPCYRQQWPRHCTPRWAAAPALRGLSGGTGAAPPHRALPGPAGREGAAAPAGRRPGQGWGKAGSGGGGGRGSGCSGEAVAAAAGRGRRYLLGGAGAAGDERQGRQAVQQEAAQGDGVGGQPQRDLLHQPGPVGLQPRLQQRPPGRAVAVLLQALQLRRAEGRGQSPGHGHAAAGTTAQPRTGQHRGQAAAAAAAARGGAELSAAAGGGRGRRPAAALREGESLAPPRQLRRGGRHRPQPSVGSLRQRSQLPPPQPRPHFYAVAAPPPPPGPWGDGDPPAFPAPVAGGALGRRGGAPRVGPSRLPPFPQAGGWSGPVVGPDAVGPCGHVSSLLDPPLPRGFPYSPSFPCARFLMQRAAAAGGQRGVWPEQGLVSKETPPQPRLQGGDPHCVGQGVLHHPEGTRCPGECPSYRWRGSGTLPYAGLPLPPSLV